MTGPAFVPPKWRKPAPLGYGNAIDSVGTVGPSLLAGFSLASVLVVTSEAGKFRWPGAAVLALTTAAVLLIASVQCTYNTRKLLWSGADVNHWWPELQEHSELEARLREEQAEAFGRWQFWAKWARTANGAGVLVLLAGLALSLPYRRAPVRSANCPCGTTTDAPMKGFPCRTPGHDICRRALRKSTRIRKMAARPGLAG